MKFVIHHHRTVPDHYDLMFEQGESLLSFRIAEDDIGALIDGRHVTAEKIQDHRKDYLSYEGPVSCDRGHVEIVDSGEYRLIETGNGFFRAGFTGKKLDGIFMFSLNDRENCWTIARE